MFLRTPVHFEEGTKNPANIEYKTNFIKPTVQRLSVCATFMSLHWNKGICSQVNEDTEHNDALAVFLVGLNIVNPHSTVSSKQDVVPYSGVV